MNRTTWLMLLVALPVLLFALGACGDDGDDADPTATESSEPLPTDADMEDEMDSEPVQLEVVSQSLSFTPGVIDAPAAVEFTIVYENAHDGVPHNFAIFMSEDDATSGIDPIAATEISAGPDAQELSVSALAAGDYFVWCQVHTSSMTASLRVE